MTQQESERVQTRGDDPTASPGADRTRDVAALDTLFEEVVALFHRLRAVAAEVHRLGATSAGLRGVLRDLDRQGPQTVPQLARRRPVSRQYMQMLVRRLRSEGLVEIGENPAHRRSHLVRLTPAGRQMLETMARRETDLLRRVGSVASPEDLQVAVRVLRTVREALAAGRWRRDLAASLEDHRERTGIP